MTLVDDPCKQCPHVRQFQLLTTALRHCLLTCLSQAGATTDYNELIEQESNGDAGGEGGGAGDKLPGVPVSWLQQAPNVYVWYVLVYASPNPVCVLYTAVL